LVTYVHSASDPQIYHWCTNCSKWPSAIGGSTATRPEGKLCDECKRKEQTGACNVND
jgi:hypothetical protein